MQDKNELNFVMNELDNDDSDRKNDVEKHSSEHHSRHGHGHHHHHHSHRSSNKRLKRKNRKFIENFRSFFRRNKKYLIHLSITLILVIALVIFGVYLDEIMTYNDSSTSEGSDILISGSTGEIQISVPFYENDVYISGPAVVEYINVDSAISVKEIFNKYNGNSNRLDVGLPVTLSYNVDKIPNGHTIKTAEFLVSENSNLMNPVLYKSGSYSTSVDIYHLKTNTKYYYRINLTFNNGSSNSVSGSFKTASGPRVLTVNGVYNLRDIGGYKTVDGKTIKQGLLYRGCEIDGLVEPKYKITAEGLNTMLSVFGIKTDMDLRVSTDNKYGTDALGSGVTHNYYSAPMYSNVLNSDINKEKIRKIFSDLSVESNYPIYIHCTYGVDRTGTVCYLLEGLLGLDGETLLKEYMLSGLHHSEISTDLMYEFIENLKLLPGDNMQEKIEGYLISIGVTSEEITNIKNIYFE